MKLNTRKKILLFSITLIVVIGCPAQKISDRDSLYKILGDAKTDSALASNYLNLSSLYITSDFDSSVFYADKAEKIAEKNNLTNLIISSKVTLAICHSLFRRDTLALRYISEALHMAQSPKKGTDKENEDNYSRVRETYFDYALIYLFICEYQKSIDYLLKVKDLNAVNPSVYQLAFVDFLIGQNNYEMGNLDTANYYVWKAYMQNPAFFNTWGFFHVLSGYINRKLGKIDSAFYHQRLGLEFAKQQSLDVINLAKANIGMAQCFYDTHQYDSAIGYAREAYYLTTTSNFPDQRYIASDLLAKVFKGKNETDSAYVFMVIAGTIKDSIYHTNKIQADQRISFDQRIQQEQQSAQKQRSANNIRILILGVILLAVIFVAIILFRSNKQKQKDKETIEQTYQDLQSTQSQLIQSEKMASLGELTAGIAHEIQNPLNFVNNFSEVNTELVDELQQELSTGNMQQAKSLANDIKENEQKINHHGKRADAIVKGMLQHSRSNNGLKELTDINALADEYLRLAYHGLRAKDKSFNATMKTDFDSSIGKINVVPQDIGRVILNLITNAFYVVYEKKKQINGTFEPTVFVSTNKSNGMVGIKVKDNGNGIPGKILDKIFQPFFTTKPTGQGTGLGLSLSYDIVKAHGGELKVNTVEGEGTEFIILLPV
jgi:signal transduction histidine kinase